MVEAIKKVLRRIAFYIRVSTDNQEKAETSGNQKRDLYKVYNKAEVVGIYEDTGSGADPDRKDLKRLLQDAKKKMFDVVAVWDGSRLARDVKLFLIIKDELKDSGVKIEIMGKEREDSDSGRLLEIIEAAVDQIERGRIKRRFISGRERRLAEKKLIGCYPPYGYFHIRRNKEKGTDAELKVNEKEARIVRLIFKWYIELESMFLVAQRLMEKKILTRGRNGKPRFFQTSTISRMLRREDYIGIHWFGKSSPCQAKFHIYKNRKYKLTGRKKNPKEEWRGVAVPAIVEKDIFYKAQEIIARRAQFARKETKHEFLCQGIIKCVDCNRNYGGRMQGGFLIYRCPQHFNSNLNNPTCRSRSMGSHKLDNAVWAYVSSLINDRNKLNNNISQLREKRENDRTSNKKVLDSLLEEKANLKSKKGKLLELYSEGKFEAGDLEEKINEFTEREKLVQTQILEVEKELKDIEATDSVEKEVEKICAIYRGKIENPTFEFKKYIVRKWVEEIRIEKNGTLRIKVRIPQGEKLEDFNKEMKFNFYPNSNLIEGPLVGLRFEVLITP